MKRYTDLFIALGGSILLWAAWPVSPLTFLVFAGWIPLLLVEERVKSRKRFFALTYLHMFSWNILTTWWIWNASLPGAISAFVANSLFMCIPWLLFSITKKNLGSWIGYGSLVVYWMAFEYLHHNWELSWPWLTLGNVFATHPGWVQWYQYSGSSGGTLWVLLVNILVFALFREYRRFGRSRVYYATCVATFVVLAGPILLSNMILSSERSIASEALAKTIRNVVIVQPNIDPYNEKFAASVEGQVSKLISLSEQQIDKNTTLVLWPETAIPSVVKEDEIRSDRYYDPVWLFLKRHSDLNLVTGINSYRPYGNDKAKASPTARHDESSGLYYDLYNTAASLDADSTVQLYHKAKLVPGVETLPSFLNFMGSWFEDLGGISGTLGRDSERKVFIPWDNYYKVAPVICYESIYGDYITEYIRKGANVLAILTNDGWWGNTPGYKQHMNYARLRAIETRKWVLRSANTGISCFIDPLGNVLDPQPWDTASAIKMNIPADSRQTYFVRHGDILSIAMLAGSIAVLLSTLFEVLRRFIRRRKTKSSLLN
ncbi:MAG: apolipoprotein N-acyltransferase [Chitinophagaceae bacterium]|nr:MAG: apolipoprotein N-acyltransferase [Chitinophagaceae bacterium]